jgi:acyl carrier protein
MKTKITNLLIDNFDWLHKDKIFLDSDLREDLQLDSISIINLQILIEDEFDIRFDPIENNLTEIFQTLNTLMKFLEKSNNESI